MKVLLTSHELSPFVSSSSLGDVAQALPAALRRLGVEMTVLTPLTRDVTERLGPLSRSIVPLRFRLGSRWWTADIFSRTTRDGVRQFFLRQDDLFGQAQPLDHLAAAVFSKAAVVLNLQHDIGFEIIHCHNWQGGLIPLFRKSTSSKSTSLSNIVTVFSILDSAEPKGAKTEDANNFGITKRFLTDTVTSSEGLTSFLAAGATHANQVTTIGPTAARELGGDETGPLARALAQRNDSVVGILNGIDDTKWSPETDTRIAATFSATSQNGKRRCKAGLQAETGLPIRPRIPVVGYTGAFEERAGFDLVLDAIPLILETLPCQFVINGKGCGSSLQKRCVQLGDDFPGRVVVRLDDQSLNERLVLAGSDMVLFPSRSETGGRDQLRAMRYGAVPVASDVGSLSDTVDDFDPESNSGTGFVLKRPSTANLKSALLTAIEVYQNPRIWRRLIATAMSCDFSWRRTAQQYVEVYKQALEK